MTDWIYGIAAVLILGGVAAEAVPEGTWRKYVRLFSGVLLILAAASPVLSLFGIADRAALSYEEGLFSSWVDQIRMQTAGTEWEEEAQRRQEEAFAEPLAALAESFGYRMESFSVEWREGEPSAIRLTVSEIVQNAALGESGQAGLQTARQGESIEEVAPVSPVGEIQNEAEISETAKAQVEAPAEETAEETAVYYEPSELRTLHEALGAAFSLSQDQVTIYLVREGEG